MKTHLLAVAVLGSLSLNAFALTHPAIDGHTQARLNLLAEGGGDRVFEHQLEHLKDARIAEGGGDRTFDRQLERIRSLRAEGGADRLFERNKARTTRG